jgi:hypothetical protein
MNRRFFLGFGLTAQLGQEIKLLAGLAGSGNAHDLRTQSASRRMGAAINHLLGQANENDRRRRLALTECLNSGYIQIDDCSKSLFEDRLCQCALEIDIPDRVVPLRLTDEIAKVRRLGRPAAGSRENADTGTAARPNS